MAVLLKPIKIISIVLEVNPGLKKKCTDLSFLKTSF